MKRIFVRTPTLKSVGDDDYSRVVDDVCCFGKTIKVRFCFVAFSSLKRKAKDASSSQNGESVTAKLLLLVMMMLMLSSSRTVLFCFDRREYKSVILTPRDVLLSKKSSLTTHKNFKKHHSTQNV